MTTTVEPEQRRLGRRLGVEHVERGAGDHALADAVGERRLVDDAAAGDVDHPQRRLRLDEQIAADQPGGLVRLRQVDREEVGSATSWSSRRSSTPSGGPGRPTRTGRRPRGACRTPRPVGDELADAAQPDDAERLVGQLDALPPAALPPAGHERGVGLGHVARLGEQQRHRVLGGRDDVALRGVDHHHAAARGRLDVDVVEPDPGPADDDQVGAAASTSSVTVVAERMIRACARDCRRQVGRRQLEPHVDVVAGRPQAVEPPSAISS